MIYINENLIHRRLHELETFCPESIWINILVKTVRYLIETFYSPETSDSLCFTNLNKNIETVFEICANVIILGSLNEDLLNPNYRKLKDVIVLNSLQNTITQATWYTSLLDPIIIPLVMQYLDSGVIQNSPEISDHSATYIYVPFPYEIKQSYERTIYLYKKD